MTLVIRPYRDIAPVTDTTNRDAIAKHLTNLFPTGQSWGAPESTPTGFTTGATGSTRYENFHNKLIRLGKGHHHVSTTSTIAARPAIATDPSVTRQSRSTGPTTTIDGAGDRVSAAFAIAARSAATTTPT